MALSGHRFGRSTGSSLPLSAPGQSDGHRLTQWEELKFPRQLRGSSSLVVPYVSMMQTGFENFCWCEGPDGDLQSPEMLKY